MPMNDLEVQAILCTAFMRRILLPSATATGATFDVELMRRIGNLLGDEARCKNAHVLLTPTVCLQRLPLMGRGFDAYAEDPILSGLIASVYINGVQGRGVAACTIYYDTHDQSTIRSCAHVVAADSIVLLRNGDAILPMRDKKTMSHGLIGDHFKLPALSGGGSAEGDHYYAVTPYDAVVEAVREENVAYTPGLYNPDHDPDTESYSTAADGDLIDVPESLHRFLPHKYYVGTRTVFTPQNSARFRFGFSVAGKGRVKLDDKEVIDLWTNQPPKTDDTPCFNRLSVERFYDADMRKGQTVKIEVLMVNEDVSGLADTVKIARSVDVPIVMVGLSADYEGEASDRRHLELPPAATHLIQAVLDANPNTIVVTQAGCTIEIPWEHRTKAIVHAWYGGQETGHAITDVLFGGVNHTGRLSVTFPRSIKHKHGRYTKFVPTYE
ncbi:Beta-glucosidase [Pleurostoma richardsiae]|uniref:Probable beta-glucosidase I n=1 Tax=Pleurostoma richardsiae TaxID=41990 RepID=A0AA38RXT6_9PEZI|nr:Beta-glucosidase [Pleurostoma richardsiae]